VTFVLVVSVIGIAAAWQTLWGLLAPLAFLRERRHESIDRDDVLDIADAEDTPDAALDRKEANGTLQTCIDKLSPAHREIINLFYYREKSIAEVSGMIGIPQATVKSRIFYARKHLARILVSAGCEVAVQGSRRIEHCHPD
jgi:RNA polymerase sigma-70 factor (ECF subfamily)